MRLETLEYLICFLHTFKLYLMEQTFFYSLHLSRSGLEQIFSRMQAGLLSSRISFLNGVVLKKLDTVQKTFKLGTVTSLQRLDLVAYTDRQLLAASLLNIQTQMMELCDDYQNYATNSEEGRQM